MSELGKHFTEEDEGNIRHRASQVRSTDECATLLLNQLNAIRMMEKQITELEKQIEAMKWISVEDRIPLLHERILLCLECY